MDSDPLMQGATAGPWIIEYELGRGGMGVVYAVVHEQIGKRAALKILHSKLFRPNADRILLEARVVNTVGHPNIVDIFDTGSLPDGRPYIVMERLDGRALSAEEDLPVDESIAILLQVCDALIAAHAAGVVHRDLKPDNIFLIDRPDSAIPRVKLLDWGIARMLTLDVRHTMEGQLVGTPQYLAPEQARGDRVSTQTDVYSLGVVAYEMILGQLPFIAASATEMLARHLLSPPRPPSELWPDIPPRLGRLLLGMLAKSPEERPTAAVVARELEVVRAELAQPVAVADVPEEPLVAPGAGVQRRWIAVCVFALTACAIMVLATRIDSPPSARPPGVDEPPASGMVVEPPPVHPTTPPRDDHVVPPPDLPVKPTAPRAARPLAIVNPVQKGCADPDILGIGAHYYMTCTGRSDGNTYPIYESTNLVRWTRAGWIFPSDQPQPSWATGNYWSPELHHAGTGIAAYFSMRTEAGHSAIGVATAPTPLGPFVDRGTPLLAPEDASASDAHVLLAADGVRYLYYKLAATHAGTPDSIWVHALTPDGLDLAPGPGVKVLDATEQWEHGVVEAPWVARNGAYYYLFYSGATYCNADYAVGVARAAGPLGPFEKLAEPILKTGSDWAGPGHIALTRGPDNRMYIAYHAYQLTEGTPTCEEGQPDDNNRRDVVIDRLVFTDGWPRVTP